MHPYKNLFIRNLQLAELGLGKTMPTPLNAWTLFDETQHVVAEGWLPKYPVHKDSFVVKPRSEHQSANLLILTRLDGVDQDLIDFISTFSITQLFVLAKVTPESASFLALHGVLVVDSLMPDEEANTNKRFYQYISEYRPYIILKWAETSDGFVARSNYDSKWISSPLSRRLVHKWRSEEEAIMVGTNTANYDNPKLNVRKWTGRNPVRIVLDRYLRLGQGLHLFNSSHPTIIYNQIKSEVKPNLSFINTEGDSYLEFFASVLTDLYSRNIQSIFVEGGSRLLQFLIENGLWNEARVFTSPVSFVKGIAAPTISKSWLHSNTQIAEDQLKIYQKLNKK